MAYDSRQGYFTATAIWRVFVPYSPTWGPITRALPGMIKPARESFYAPSVARRTGYQVDLMEWHIGPAEAEWPDACSYPDW